MTKMTRAEFMVWVSKMCDELYNKFNDRYYILTRGAHFTVCVDDKTGKVGLARCKEGDSYDVDIGRAIAYARCRGYGVPQIGTFKKLSEMKNGDIFCDNLTKLRFIGVCKNYQNDDVFAVQMVDNNRVFTLTHNVSYEIV